MHHLCQPDCSLHSHSPLDQFSRSAAPGPSSHPRALWIALLLLLGFALVEAAAGVISHSLALVAESGHMLSDGIALGLALLASWVARFPASDRATFGYRRVEILAALVNGVGLLGVAGWIGWEALTRLHQPPAEILSLPMLITAAIGLIVNSLNAGLLHQDSHHNLNIRGAFLHMVADAISSVGVMVAAVAVWLWQWTWMDGVISIAVALLIGLSTLPLIRQSLDILLEKPPAHLEVAQIQSRLLRFAGVRSVEHLRLWSIALGQTVLSAHLTTDIEDGAGRDQLVCQIQIALQQEFAIQEVILQLTASPPPLNLSPLNLSMPSDLESLLS